MNYSTGAYPLPAAGQDPGSGEAIQAIMMMLGAKGAAPAAAEPNAGVMGSDVIQSGGGYMDPGGYAPAGGLTSYDAPSYDYAPAAMPNVQPAGPYNVPAAPTYSGYNTSQYGQLGMTNNSY